MKELRRGRTSGKQAARCQERAKLSMLFGPPAWRIRENEDDLDLSGNNNTNVDLLEL
jgi:hypothetical protein